MTPGPRGAIAAGLVLVACAGGRAAIPPPEYEAAIETARRTPGGGGALAACAENLDRLATIRAAELRALEATPVWLDEQVAILEIADVAELRYGIAAVVGEYLLQRGRTGSFVRRGHGDAGLRAAIARMADETKRGVASDEVLAGEVQDGTCYFLSLRVKGEWFRYALYMPQLSGSGATPGQLALTLALSRRLRFVQFNWDPETQTAEPSGSGER